MNDSLDYLASQRYVNTEGNSMWTYFDILKNFNSFFFLF